MQYHGNRAGSALALLLLLLFALVQFSSNGVVRHGGEDEGSGIGGTGRTLPTTGEGGIGGTGLKPYLTINDAQEIQIRRDPSQRDTAAIKAVPRPLPAVATNVLPVPRVATVIRESEITLDSSAIDISEAIQLDLDSNALLVTTLQNELTTSAATTVSPVTVDSADPSTELQAPDTDVNAVVASTENDVQPETGIKSWADLARILNQSKPEAPQTDTSSSTTELANLNYSADSARLTRPERIQRPELPPIQRVSPLSRTAILPPRIKPLRL